MAALLLHEVDLVDVGDDDGALGRNRSPQAPALRRAFRRPNGKDATRRWYARRRGAAWTLAGRGDEALVDGELLDLDDVDEGDHRSWSGREKWPALNDSYLLLGPLSPNRWQPRRLACGGSD